MLDHCEENLSWEDIRRITTEAATQVFGFTTRPHPRPWLTGHEAEIKEWSDNISGIKRRFENAKDLCDSNHHTEEDVETRDRLARELRTAKRQKVNTLKRWEQHYWHNVGREAEIAEHRGDSYALYKIMNKLKLRGTTRRNLGERHLADDPLAEAASWRKHFRQIQNGATPVAERVWRNIETSPVREDLDLGGTPDCTGNS